MGFFVCLFFNTLFIKFKPQKNRRCTTRYTEQDKTKQDETRKNASPQQYKHEKITVLHVSPRTESRVQSTEADFKVQQARIKRG